MRANGRREVEWTPWQGDGRERLAILRTDEGWLAQGSVTGEGDMGRYALSYRLALDPGWHVRDVLIRVAEGPELSLLSDGRGRWTLGDGTASPALDGCLDVDISATPFTNTLPVRRLGLETGESRTIRVAFVAVPRLSLEAVEQSYTRLSENRFLYKGLSTGFSAELEVDQDGLVLDYPGVFRRVT